LTVVARLFFSVIPVFAQRKTGTHEHGSSPMTYWVYILASGRHGTLYVGVTNSLERQIWDGAPDRRPSGVHGSRTAAARLPG
jgi:hypothetical protein